MMSSRSKYVSIFIVPDDGSKATRLRLRRPVYRLLIVLLPVLLVFAAVSLFFWGRSLQLLRENSMLQAENAKVRQLALELEQVKAIDRQLRLMTGADIELSPAAARSAYVLIDSLKETSSGQQRDVPSIWPTQGRVSSEFGEYRGLMGKRHEGIDIAAASGTPVRATADGKVLFAGWTDDLGNLVIIKHGGRYFTRYGHNDKVYVKEGQLVKRGQVIATVGSSGHSTAPHLHYEVWEDAKPVNPRRFLPRKE
ncbi:MAG: M23 family metallopeptidase [Candidatus Latescibacteria bacterium]|nr:M23 family metallopeptidase [Candidatus Latescibacterota bacterium]